MRIHLKESNGNFTQKGGKMTKRGPPPHTNHTLAICLACMIQSYLVRVVTINLGCKAEQTNGQLVVNYFTRKKSLANLFVCLLLAPHQNKVSSTSIWRQCSNSPSTKRQKLPADQHLPSCLQGPADQKVSEEPVQPLHL
jgi:hypothetical protein